MRMGRSAASNTAGLLGDQVQERLGQDDAFEQAHHTEDDAGRA